jgi:hypothetical protein
LNTHDHTENTTITIKTNEIATSMTAVNDTILRQNPFNLLLEKRMSTLAINIIKMATKATNIFINGSMRIHFHFLKEVVQKRTFLNKRILDQL